MEYQIEKGIPITEIEQVGRPRPRTPMRKAFDEMEIGDSIVIPSNMTNSAHAVSKLAKIKVALRSQKNGTHRVWRIA